MRFRRAPFLALVLPIALAACGGARTPAAAASAPHVEKAAPGAARAVIVPTDDDSGGTAQEVFDRATKLLEAGQPKKARALFDRVVAADRAERGASAAPSALGRSAAFDAALCSVRLEETTDARDRFRALGSALVAADGTPIPDSAADAADAFVQRARLDVELEDDADLEVATRMLGGFPTITGTARAEVVGLTAIARVHTGDLDVAEKLLAPALKAVDAPEEGPFPPPQHAAAVHFAHGELLRARGNAITFVPVGPEFPVRMETRCQRILDAEAAYIEAIKTKEIRWAVRSGLRVGSMYVALHDALIDIPPPKGADTDAKKSLFRGAMRLRYRILLEKGLGTLDKTIGLEASTGVKSPWLEHTKKAKEHLEKTLAEEKAEIAKLPYTEEQLQKAFDDLSGKAPTTKPATTGKPTKP